MQNENKARILSIIIFLFSLISIYTSLLLIAGITSMYFKNESLDAFNSYKGLYALSMIIVYLAHGLLLFYGSIKLFQLKTIGVKIINFSVAIVLIPLLIKTAFVKLTIYTLLLVFLNKIDIKKISGSSSNKVSLSKFLSTEIFSYPQRLRKIIYSFVVLYVLNYPLYLILSSGADLARPISGSSLIEDINYSNLKIFPLIVLIFSILSIIFVKLKKEKTALFLILLPLIQVILFLLLLPAIILNE